MVDKFKAEADENKLSVNEDMAENKFLDAVTKGKLAAVLNYAGFGFGDKITTMQLFIKESYEYDRNGNRIKTVTKNGAIDYSYDEENRLVSSGSNGRVCVKYTYDRNGNMLMQKSELKTTKYVYNLQNRLCYSQAIDRENKTQSVSRYGYDTFGRRILVQDRDEACMKSIYDGFTFDIIKQSPTFANGMFTDSNETGLRISRTGRPTGDRYRYLEDDKNDGNRYYNIDDGSYRTVSGRFRGSRSAVYVNGSIAAQNADGDVSYFTADLLGSVRAATDSSGFETDTYTYDAFGSLVQGDLSGAKDLGYLSKQFDKATELYNYGYRDYKPDVSRFTTVDPIRDGTNWFVYCDGDSVNFVDLWGLSVSDGNKTAIFPTAENALNLDFGRDYSAMAVQNFKNGHPVLGTIQMLDSACEIVYDVVAAYGSASIISTFVTTSAALPETTESWLQQNGKPNYPPNNGAALHTEVTKTLEVGTKVGRYGDIGPKSSFVTDTTSTASELSLPPWTNPATYQEFTVVKPITNVVSSEVEAWADSAGGGTQYVLPQTIIQLQQDGFIR